MFFDGDLQSGIQDALQKSKLVVCFLTDDGQESIRWQDDYLKDGETARLLAGKAVLLRLVDGSKEVAYFKEYYPVHIIPSIYVIQ